jgi:hypothetical protein
MTGEAPNKPIDVPFLITASELRDRKAKRRGKPDDLQRAAAFPRVAELKVIASDLFRPPVL